MANEISYTVSLACAKGTYFNQSRKPGSQAADQATQGAAGDVQAIGFAADEVIAYGDLVAPRWCFLRNLDTTNYIKVGPTTGGAILEMIRLKPGESCLFPIGPSVVLRAQSAVAACNLEKFILET